MEEIQKRYEEMKRKWRAVERERPDAIIQPAPGQESVWDYPRPPEIQPAEKVIQVKFGGVTLTHSERALRVVETASPPAYYLPPEDVRMEYLIPSEKRTFCEWKGIAHYWDVQVKDQVARNAAWSYPDPEEGYEALQDYLAFYPEKMDSCTVGQEQVESQPGGFYGGWVTEDIVGPFKGGPGTERW